MWISWNIDPLVNTPTDAIVETTIYRVHVEASKDPFIYETMS